MTDKTLEQVRIENPAVAVSATDLLWIRQTGQITDSVCIALQLKTYIVNGYALLAGPAFTGVPTAPTAVVGTNTTQLATTAFTAAQIAASSQPLSATLTSLASTTRATDTIPYYNSSTTAATTAFTSTARSFVAATTVTAARTSISAAASGANTDITSLTQASGTIDGFTIGNTTPAGATLTKLNVGTNPGVTSIANFNTSVNASTSYGIFVQPTYGDAAATTVYGVFSRTNSADAATNLTLSVNYSAATNLKVAGGVVTTNIGFDVSDQNVGVSNYGYRGQLASGTNKYNLYMIGSAPNLMTGQLQLNGGLTDVGTTLINNSGSAATTIGGTGSTGNIAIGSTANAVTIAGSSTSTLDGVTIGSLAQAPGTFGDVGAGNGTFRLRSLVGTPTSPAMYNGGSTDSATNYVLSYTTGVLGVNATTGINFRISAGTSIANISSTGVAIGQGATTATAKLQLGAGTATAGSTPLKFTAGTLTTTAETGALEYDASGNLYITDTGSYGRKQLARAGTAQGFQQVSVNSNISLSAWGTSGAQFITSNTTVTDTTSSGTNSNTTVFNAYAVPTLAATTATTYSGDISTVYIAGPPAAGTNVTISAGNYALLINAGGSKIIGLTNINNTGGSATNIGTGTGTGSVNFGNPLNSVNINSAVKITATAISAPAWNTTGVGFYTTAATYTDTTSSGTNSAQQAIHAIAAPTLSATSATTYSSNIATLFIAGAPITGTNVTFTGAQYAMVINSGGARIIGGNSSLSMNPGNNTFSLASTSLTINSSAGTNTTSIANGTTTGNVNIGGGSNAIVISSSSAGTMDGVTIGSLAQAPGTFGDVGTGNVALTIRGQVGSPTTSVAIYPPGVTASATNYGIRLSNIGGVVINPSATGQLAINTNVIAQWTSTGLLVGSTSVASAKLHLASGTATAGSAPLKFTAGTLLTTPEACAFEVDTNGAPYFTKSTSRSQFALQNQNNNFTQMTLTGSFSQPFWGNSGIGLTTQGSTYTDSSSSGAVATELAVHSIAAPTIAAASVTTYGTNVSTLEILGPPIAGTNVTFGGSTYALNINNGGMRIGGTSLINLAGAFQLNVNNGSNTTSIGTGTTIGNVSIGGGSNKVNVGSPLQLTGSYSAPAWNTQGIGLIGLASTYTDSTSSGTNANLQVIHGFAQPTIAAASATTYSNNVATVYIANAPAVGTNVTFTGNPYALLIGSGVSRFAGGAVVNASLSVGGVTAINVNSTTSTTAIGTGTTTGAVTIGSSSNTTNLSSASTVLAGILTLTSYTVATLPSTAVTGSVVYCSNCRNITGFTSTGSGTAATPVQEGSGAGTGNVVVYRSVGGTAGWYIDGSFNTIALA